MHRIRSLDARSRDLQTARAVWAWTKWAAPCASARGPASSSPVRSPQRPTAPPKSPSAIATATNSIANTRKRLPTPGFRITGRTPDGTYVEIIEVPDHPWFVGCQFHPEFKSKPLAPHPLFAAFVRAAVENRHNRLAHSSEAHTADARAAEARTHASDTASGPRASAASS